MPFHKLVKGFSRFRQHYFSGKNTLYPHLVRHGQTPETLVIACSDSRNDPALLTQSEPGDIFVVRNVAAIVPPYQPDSQYHGTSAAIEFAVKGLNVKNIIVLGHSFCGGIDALLTNSEENRKKYEFLNTWIEIGTAARDAVCSELHDAPKSTKLQALEQAVIINSLNNLMTFPWISERVHSGHITLYGWHFDMLQGKMLGLDHTTGLFSDISQKTLTMAFMKQDAHFCGCGIDKLIQNYKSIL
jgi:carbonic anhydrase